MFERHFFGKREESLKAYTRWTDRVRNELTGALPEKPCSGENARSLRELLADEICPATGESIDNAVRRLALVTNHSIALWHPNTAAHLHTPVVLPAVAAEMAISALNQSMDSFDQAPAATVIEQLMVEWLGALVGYKSSAAGTFTAGGTQSNYMGLLLARDHFLQTKWNWSVRENGLPPGAGRLRILCSDAAHFSVEKSAIQLGLGLKSVVRIQRDERFRMCPSDLLRQIRKLRNQGLEPIAVFATAGTTDFGSFDPIADLATIARAENLWLHVDAAYGGAKLLSPRLRTDLAGIEQADSVTLDFHKAFFQPISCGAFLLQDQRRFDLIRVHADYLNPEDREQGGIPDLVTRSVLTTRRFDALKLWMSLHAIGRDEYAAMVERICELARFAANRINGYPDFELLHSPEMGCVVFRYDGSDAINAAIYQSLFDAGEAVAGHTVVKGRRCLKLTISNPCTREEHITVLLEMIRERARALKRTDAQIALKASDLFAQDAAL